MAIPGERDRAIFDLIAKEKWRQENHLELIASENFVSSAVLEAQGSILTNKYAEGYPKKRYYGGCEYVDGIEDLAIERVCRLYGVEAANVQPHSGSQANMAAYFTLAKPGDRLLGMDLSHGGHLTHGSPVNFSGRLFEVFHYGLHPDTHLLDYDRVRALAREHRPRVIIAGASAYPRVINFEVFGAIAAEVSADLVVDMAHIAGLVAAQLHPSPIPYATLTTSTTHKTLRGPRGGIVLGSKERIKAVNSQIFPGIQGGPLMHVVAAKAVAFGEALRPGFRDYQSRVLANARQLAENLQERGFDLVTGGTDNHLLLVDLSHFLGGEITGKDAEIWLDAAGLTVNKNTIPNEKRSPFVTSGIRIGVPAVTTRGLKQEDMQTIAKWIFLILESRGDAQCISKTRREVEDLCRQYPL